MQIRHYVASKVAIAMIHVEHPKIPIGITMSHFVFFVLTCVGGVFPMHPGIQYGLMLQSPQSVCVCNGSERLDE